MQIIKYHNEFSTEEAYCFIALSYCIIANTFKMVYYSKF